MSNAELNTEWPKVKKSKDVLSFLLKNDEIHPWELLSILNDTRKAKDDELPDTGVGMEWEKVLSSIFIQSPKYGTRCSTAVVVDIENNVRFVEKTFFGNLGIFSNKDYRFKIKD